MAQRFEEQSFTTCLCNLRAELDVFVDAHMGDLQGTGSGCVLDQIQANFSQKIRFKILDSERSGHDVGTSQT